MTPADQTGRERWTLHTGPGLPIICSGKEYCWYCYAPSDHEFTTLIEVVPAAALAAAEIKAEEMENSAITYSLQLAAAREEIASALAERNAEIKRAREAEARVAEREKAFDMTFRQMVIAQTELGRYEAVVEAARAYKREWTDLPQGYREMLSLRSVLWDALAALGEEKP